MSPRRPRRRTGRLAEGHLVPGRNMARSARMLSTRWPGGRGIGPVGAVPQAHVQAAGTRPRAPRGLARDRRRGRHGGHGPHLPRRPADAAFAHRRWITIIAGAEVPTSAPHPTHTLLQRSRFVCPPARRSSWCPPGLRPLPTHWSRTSSPARPAGYPPPRRPRHGALAKRLARAHDPVQVPRSPPAPGEAAGGLSLGPRQGYGRS